LGRGQVEPEVGIDMKRFTYSGTPLGKTMMEVVAACALATKANRRADTNFIATRTEVHEVVRSGSLIGLTETT
jgi:hypothetical protein